MKYLLICDRCGNKEGSDGTQVNLAKIVNHANVPGVAKRQPKFRCPKCGFMFRLVKNEKSNKDNIS